MATRCYDFIGDIHGCYDELVDLLALLGYVLHFGPEVDGLPVLESVEAPCGRQLLFVGDLVDRGPANDKVLSLVMQLVEHGVARCVKGNHDDKLHRALSDKPVNIGRARKLTLASIAKHGEAFRAKVLKFLEQMVAIIEEPAHKLKLVHAAYREGQLPARTAMLAIYGEGDDSGDSDSSAGGHNCDWEKDYCGTDTVVRGHDVVEWPTMVTNASGGQVINLDTGCVFGGRLSALRFPEMQFLMVPARALHWGKRKK